eukprot:7454477-Alexandrium_andersonii.AAC.1
MPGGRRGSSRFARAANGTAFGALRCQWSARCRRSGRTGRHHELVGRQSALRGGPLEEARADR